MNININVVLRYLLPTSLLYLSLPYAIFFIGYLRWYFALLFLAFLIIGLFHQFTPLRKTGDSTGSNHLESEPPAIEMPQLILLLFLALLLLMLSGVSGYGYQDEDWLKHSAILGDLIKHPWPLSYKFLNSNSETLTSFNIPLVYYIAYYLPSAVIGKLGGWFWANQFLFLWSYIGLCLAMLWFMVLVRRAAFFPLLIFACFSGLDCVGMAIVRMLTHQPIALLSWQHIEGWAGNWVYSSHVTLLFWVPNQALAGWIASGLILRSLLYTNSKRNVWFYLSLTPLWSPFIALGLFFYLLSDFLTEKKHLSKKLRDSISVSNVCGLAMLFLLGLFYSSRLSKTPLSLAPIERGLIFFNPRVSGLFWYETLGLLMLFLLLEFGIYGLIISRSRRPFNVKERKVFMTTMLFLSLLPLFRYGHWNDLVMRASIPSLFILCIFVVRTLYSRSLKKKATLILIAALIMGTITVSVEFSRHIGEAYRTGKFLQLQAPRELPEIRYTELPLFFLQYVGSPDTLFFKFIAKRLDTSAVAVFTKSKN